MSGPEKEVSADGAVETAQETDTEPDTLQLTAEEMQAIIGGTGGSSDLNPPQNNQG